MAVLDPDREHFSCDGTIIVRLDGEIDIATAEDAYFRLSSAVLESCAVVDLSGVGFIDASGVNALIGAARLASGRQRHLLIASAPRQLHRILDVLELRAVLPTHQDTVAARATHAAWAAH
ncbi:STAS domain-containing protein [Nocardiopsis sp. JB363]|uniref:STAS domain-containing protein n=1 Tax=Nocardiopsis sp. JB363 TaxID=1434837 RepID=UPI00097AFEBF|nr:STAS domain-containing protein [Nocardiopsis sp. JB363]SIO84860.1 anti-sigma F factor antagonist (spoIIAA-2); anti sigma b factor antagonist RsbV [Nocardiopsis sp. JB363]